MVEKIHATPELYAATKAAMESGNTESFKTSYKAMKKAMVSSGNVQFMGDWEQIVTELAGYKIPEELAAKIVTNDAVDGLLETKAKLEAIDADEKTLAVINESIEKARGVKSSRVGASDKVTRTFAALMLTALSYYFENALGKEVIGTTLAESIPEIILFGVKKSGKHRDDPAAPAASKEDDSDEEDEEDEEEDKPAAAKPKEKGKKK